MRKLKIDMSVGFGDMKVAGDLGKRRFNVLVGMEGKVSKVKTVNKDNTF